jgi:hypothetical protein
MVASGRQPLPGGLELVHWKVEWLVCPTFEVGQPNIAVVGGDEQVPAVGRELRHQTHLVGADRLKRTHVDGAFRCAAEGRDDICAVGPLSL